MKFRQYKNLAFLLIGLQINAVSAAQLSLTDVPLYLGISVQPNVMLMLDNSGSMKQHMFDTGFNETKTSYNNSSTYFGMFDETTTYKYSTSVPVNPDAYDGTSDAAYNVTVDTTKTGAFYQTSCNPAVDTDCWSGNYLNWLTTRRIDATRAVLIGGKLESRTAYNYGTISGTSYNYKIVAQNEPDDRGWAGLIADSFSYTPIPNGTLHQVFSPAHVNTGTVQTTYDPYAKIRVVKNAIYNSSGTQIGEVGTATADEVWETISFADYTNPVVVANPGTFNGGDPGTVAIRNVSGTTDTFEVAFFEWDYRDGGHADEAIGYIVLESGEHTLPGGAKIVAGTHTTNTHFSRVNGPCNVGGAFTTTNVAAFDTVSLPATAFSSDPVVIASVTTVNNDPDPDDIDTIPVSVRVEDIDEDEFDVALQQEEALADLTPLSETISYVAIEPTGGTPIVDATNNWTMSVGTLAGVTHNDSTFTLGGVFTSTPTFIANTITSNGTDPIAVRLKSLATDSVTLDVQEEQSCDSEQSHGTAETVGYIGFEGETSEYNIALLAEDEPKGLLQDISTDVRLGVSFYRFPTAGPHGTWGIYNGVTTDGGTMRFNIPNNPFVSFPATNGGFRNLTGYITSPIEDIVDAVEHYPLVWGTTPLAENLWEVIQYFEQDDPHFIETGVDDGFEKATTSTPTLDPYYYSNAGQKLWCAKSSVILFTDGEPFRDNSSPSTILDYDGDGNSEDGQEHGDDLDDVAYWGFCDTSSGGGSCVGETNGTRDLRSDIYGGTDDPGQYLRVHAVRFAGSSLNQIMIDTANNAGGDAYFAADGAALETALTSAFQAASLDSSAAAAAVNSGSVSSNTRVYQGRFNSGDWSGELISYPLVTDPTTGVVSLGSELWDASENMPAADSRIIFTTGASGAQPFRWGTTPDTLISSSLGSENVLNFIRGDQANEIDNGGSFRNRSTALGDLVNSAPVLMQPPNSFYPDDWGATGVNEPEDGATNAYSKYVSDNSSRAELIFVGANDGMFHAFDTNGVEQFAYVPKTVYKNLASLSNSSYNHKYFVDGSPTVIDAFFGGSWKTVAVSGLGAGGQGVFAIDVTNPNSFNTETNAAGKLLWEFTDEAITSGSSTIGDADLGYTFSKPNIVRLANGKWAAVFGNGYNNTEDNEGDGTTNDSTTGNAVLYVVDIQTGAIIKKFDTEIGSADDPTGANRPNGLASPTIVDVNDDFIGDLIYVGDLFGNVWKIDITGSTVSGWDFAYTDGLGDPQPLYTACASANTTCPSTDVQPITTRVRFTEHPTETGYLIYFGTGKYIESTDNSVASEPNQSFYGIWDKDLSTLTTFDRDDLLQQEIENEVSQSGAEVRQTTDHSIDWATHNGWFIDLINTGEAIPNNDGERQVTTATLRNGQVLFTTLIPSDDPCGNGGDSWKMALELYSGSRLEFTPFDLNGDFKFDNNDYITTGSGSSITYTPTSGVKSTNGIYSSGTYVSNGTYDVSLHNNTATGNTEAGAANAGPNTFGRQSWRQLDF